MNQQGQKGGRKQGDLKCCSPCNFLRMMLMASNKETGTSLYLLMRCGGNYPMGTAQKVVSSDSNA